MKSIFRQQPSNRLISGNFYRCQNGQNACQIAEDFWQVSSVTYYGTLKRYNGSSWVKEPLKRYNGSSWVTAVLKVYKDGSFKLVNTTGV